MPNIDILYIYGIVIILLVVVADLTFKGNREGLNLGTAIQTSTQAVRQKFQWIIGASIFSLRFFLSTAFIVSGVLILCLLIGGALNEQSINSKIVWVLPVTLCAGAFSMSLSHIVINQLYDKQRLPITLLWLLFWLLTPVVLWLGVMHFGTWLEWRESNSPLAYASEWFYAQVYDDYFRNPVGFTITLAIATAIATPVVAPMIGIATQTIRSITNLKRGVVSIFVIILISITLQYDTF